MSKPTVTFTRFSKYDYYAGGYRIAWLEGIKGHPKLGDQRLVYTSQVYEDKKDESGEIVWLETQNTIYVKET